MKIQYVKIGNYRNLNDCEVFFHKDSNYIIGENNIGKSNLLSLLDTVFAGRSFTETDFEDETCPIEVTLQLYLSEHEQGFFGDLFSPEDSNVINIIITQDINEALQERENKYIFRLVIYDIIILVIHIKVGFLV